MFIENIFSRELRICSFEHENLEFLIQLALIIFTFTRMKNSVNFIDR